MIHFNSTRALSSVVLALLLPLHSMHLHAQEAPSDPGDSLESVWLELEGTWIRYNGDSYMIKRITKGRVSLEVRSSLGELFLKKESKLTISEQDGILRFIESENRLTNADGSTSSPDPYTGFFKIDDGTFWEWNQSVFRSVPGAPQLWRNNPADDPGEALLIASREGDIAKVVELLDAGVPIDFTSQNSYTGLAYASGCGHLELMKTFIDRGANINQAGRFLKTPLALAIQGGKLDSVKLLLENGANPAIRIQHGLGMVNEASFWGHPELVEFLISFGMSANETSANNGWTALHSAAYRAANGPDDRKDQWIDCAKLLFKGGADSKAENQAGVTPEVILRGAGLNPDLIFTND